MAIEFPESKATACCFAENELVVGFSDGMLRVWDVRGQRWSETIDRHQQAITSLTYHRKGEVTSASRDGSVCVWDVRGKEERASVRFEKPITVCTYVPNGRMLLLAFEGDNAFFYKMENGARSPSFEGFPQGEKGPAFDFLTDTREHQSKRFVACAATEGGVAVWSVETMTVASRFGSGEVTALSCHPERMCFVVGGASDPTIRLWESVDC